MFIIIGIIIFGVCTGIIFRSKINPTIVSKLMSTIICALLLVLGIMVGSNEHIVSNLATLGYKAFIITMGAILGSVIVAFALEKLLFNKGKKVNER